MAKPLLSVIDEQDFVKLLDGLLIAAKVQSVQYGYRAEFEFRRQNVLLDLYSDGSNFASISSYWTLREDFCASEMLPRLNRLNRKLRFVKFQWFAKGPGLLVSIEFMTTGVNDLRSVLPAYLDALHNGALAATA